MFVGTRGGGALSFYSASSYQRVCVYVFIDGGPWREIVCYLIRVEGVDAVRFICEEIVSVGEVYRGLKKGGYQWDWGGDYVG